MGFFDVKPLGIPTPAEALPGRDTPMVVKPEHHALGRSIIGPFPAGLQRVTYGMGCFWGAERRLWLQPGVWTTFVGYAGGSTPNPTYREVCSGRTGHAEVVVVYFDPTINSLTDLTRLFFESHDPTQGMRQGNDIGTQYRSAVYVDSPQQLEVVRTVRDAYQNALSKAGIYRPITTELAVAGPVYYAEDEHQQYLSKNPGGYCGLNGTGVACPIGMGIVAR